MKPKTSIRAALCCLMAVVVVACGSLTWNRGVAAASKAIEDTGIMVDRYEKLGVITNAQEDSYLSKLQTANVELRRADSMHAICSNDTCATTEEMLAAINQLTIDITNELLAREAARNSRGTPR